MSKSYFISFEGGEGTGKSTQIKLLKNYLTQNSFNVFVTREPGGSDGAESIRKLLVEGNINRWDAETESLLMYAARRDNYVRFIKPNLDRGKIVICDRFSDSTRVYQGYVGNVPKEFLKNLHKITLGKIEPDITFLLDLDVQLGLSRATKRSGFENRFEQKGIHFHELVRKSYLKLAKEFHNRVIIIDASGSIKEVHDKILNEIKSIFKLK